jgi:pimeloyl-ACP methyl ester carboxylesterase
MCQDMLVDHALTLPMALLWPGGADWPVRIVRSRSTRWYPFRRRRAASPGQAVGRADRVVRRGPGRRWYGGPHQLDGQRAGFINKAFDLMCMDAIVDDPERLTRYSMPDLVREAGAQGTELMTWIAARGALTGSVGKVHSNYHIPISNTAAALMVLENEAQLMTRRANRRPERVSRLARRSANGLGNAGGSGHGQSVVALAPRTRLRPRGVGADPAAASSARGVPSLRNGAGIEPRRYGRARARDGAEPLRTGGTLDGRPHRRGGRAARPGARGTTALLDTGWRDRPAGGAGRRALGALLPRLRRAGMRAMGRVWVQQMVHPARLTDALLIDAILDMIDRQTPDRFAEQVAALLARPDTSTVLRGLRCPTLVLCGREDAWSPLAQHEEIAAMIPGARFVPIEDCGHMAPMEQPDRVAAALVGWLRTRSPRGESERQWAI